MIVGPRYNDVDPAVEAAYEREAEAEIHGCSDECGGCYCHIAPPCHHCVEHVTEES